MVFLVVAISLNLLTCMTELDCSTAQLALAWLARDPNTSTIILGASKPEQVIDNLKALDVIPKLTPEIMEKIENILGNKPEPPVRPLSGEGGKSLLCKYNFLNSQLTEGHRWISLEG